MNNDTVMLLSSRGKDCLIRITLAPSPSRRIQIKKLNCNWNTKTDKELEMTQ